MIFLSLRYTERQRVVEIGDDFLEQLDSCEHVFVFIRLPLRVRLVSDASFSLSLRCSHEGTHVCSEFLVAAYISFLLCQ